jgi:hypothetical protein
MQGLEGLRRIVPSVCVGCCTAGRWSRMADAWVRLDSEELRRLLRPTRNADSRSVLGALCTSSWLRQRPKDFEVLCGYLQAHGYGIDVRRQIPACLLTGPGRRPPALKAGSGPVGKNIEVEINRRFKRQGRSWHPTRGERLMQFERLLARPPAGHPDGTSNPNVTSTSTRLRSLQLAIDEHHHAGRALTFGHRERGGILGPSGHGRAEGPWHSVGTPEATAKKLGKQTS